MARPKKEVIDKMKEQDRTVQKIDSVKRDIPKQESFLLRLIRRKKVKTGFEK